MKNNNNNIYKNSNKYSIGSNNDSSKIDMNNLKYTDTQHLKNSLNKVKNLCNILKEKNNIIDGMLLSTKKRKKILIKENSDKENEIMQLENEIKIYFNKLFSEYFHGDNTKTRILSKIKFLRRELTQSKYTDYLNKKIMVEQKEEKMQKKLSLLTTEQLEQFNKEIYNKQIFNNDKDRENIELMKKQYEDIKKTEIFKKIFGEIKQALYNNNGSMNSSLVNSKKRFNSKLLNINRSNHGSCTSLHNSSQINYDMRSAMFSNKNKRKKANHSVENKNIYRNTNSLAKDDTSATKKYLLTNKNYGPKSYVSNSSINKNNNNKYNSKLFISNQYL